MKIAVEGRLSALSAQQERLLLGRSTDPDSELARRVRATIRRVRAAGDAALRRMVRRYDGVQLGRLEVPRERWEVALAGLDSAVRRALERAAQNIAAFHRSQLPRPFEVSVEPGVKLGCRFEPLGKVGAYVPGGRASYPSSLLMCTVPARVAGVEEVVVCSPPLAGGEPAPSVLAACVIAGVDRVFAVGGAGAIAALAYGTETVPRVDAIVGPGNRYVTEAKRQVAMQVAVDCPAGPSEVLIVADESASPRLVALEMLAQAEHDPDAAAVLVTVSPGVARAVREELAAALAVEPRREIAAAALAAQGALLVADTMEEALAFAARYAPEHLLLLTADPRRDLERVRNAGTVFLGGASSVVFGDYMTGANHVLPTGGLARSFAGLSVATFLRQVTYQELSAAAAAAMAEDAAVLAEEERLPAHAAAALARRFQ
jgi:histidinol dehydrogenase